MNLMWTTALAAIVAVSASVSAQSDKNMTNAMHDDMAKVTYTGCVQTVNHGSWFLLAHAESGGQKAMKHDMAMQHDMAMESDHMMADSFALAGRSDFAKHVGQKVTVVGALSDKPAGTMQNHLQTLTVGSLKVVAKSCS